MDPDRKSTVSSFYGGRKSSFDALNHDLRSPQTATYDGAQVRHDDASSFFNQDGASRTSGDILNNTSAGYNRMSFLHAGREEPLKGGNDEEESGRGTWDVFADFNNTGPRYSAAFVQNSQGYQQLDQPSPAKLGGDTPTGTGPVEMVTVPALGPEWKRSEMREMTKAGKREKKKAERTDTWKQWKRDQRGLCGGWLTRKVFVFVLFGICLSLGIILYFTIPRVPSFATKANSPLSNATGTLAASIPVVFSRFPANFSFPAYAELQLNTQSNWLPLTFLHLRAQVFDLDTNKQVATGDLGRKTVPAKGFPTIRLPLNFTYVASNDTDQTWKNWYDACKNRALYADGNRPPVRFRLILDSLIQGLPGSRASSTQVTNGACPIQLPSNSV